MIVPLVTRPSRIAFIGLVPVVAFAPATDGRATATLFAEECAGAAALATPKPPIVTAATTALATSDDFLVNFIQPLPISLVS